MTNFVKRNVLLSWYMKAHSLFDKLINLPTRRCCVVSNE